MRFKAHFLRVHFKKKLREYSLPITQSQFRISCKILVRNLTWRDNFRDGRRLMANVDRTYLTEIRKGVVDCFMGLRFESNNGSIVSTVKEIWVSGPHGWRLHTHSAPCISHVDVCYFYHYQFLDHMDEDYTLILLPVYRMLMFVTSIITS
jgi:hypothetical protein